MRLTKYHAADAGGVVIVVEAIALGEIGFAPAGMRRVVLGIHEIALSGEQRLALEVLQRIGQVPFVAAASARPRQVGQIAAAARRHAALDAQLVARKVLLQHHVDHAGYRIGSVDSRCAGSEHFDTFDGRGRDIAEVLEIALAAVGQRVIGGAMAIDQQQAAAGTHVAHVQRAGVAGVLTPLRIAFDRADRLSQRAQRVVGRSESLFPDLVTGDDIDRRGPLYLSALDARPGDRDRIELRGVGLVAGGFLGRHGQGRNDGQKKRAGQNIATKASGLFHLVIPDDGDRTTDRSLAFENLLRSKFQAFKSF